MALKLRYLPEHQVLVGPPGWSSRSSRSVTSASSATVLPNQTVHGRWTSIHWDSVRTTLDPTSFPNPNLTASESHWRVFPLEKKIRLHEEKYYPKDLGEPMKSEYFQSLSLF